MFEQKINNLIGKRMPRAIGGQKGYTLVEIIVVIVILGIIGGITFQIVGAVVETFKMSRDRKELYDQGRLALERMTRELRDAYEITDCSPGSYFSFKVAHPTAYGVIEEIKYQLNGTDLERVADGGTPAVLASKVDSFQVGEEGAGGIAIDAKSDGYTDGGSSITISHTTSGTDRLMLVGVSVQNEFSEEVKTVTWNGTEALTLEGVVVNPADARVEIWSLVAPSTGTHNVVITFINPGSAAIVGVVTFTGVDQTTPLGAFASAISPGDHSTASVPVTSADGELVFAVAGSEWVSLGAVGGGQTEHWNIFRNVTHPTGGAGSTKPGASGTVTMSWDLNGTDDWAIGGFSIKASGSTSMVCGGWGSITLDSTSDQSTGGQTLSWQHTIGGESNRLLVVMIGVEGDFPSLSDVNSVTYNGTTLTKAVENDVGAFQNTELWYMLESSLPAAGTYTVQVSTSGVPNDTIKAGAVSVYGAAQSGPEDINSQDDNQAPWGSIQTSITTLTDGAWVFDCVGSGELITFTQDAGQTERFDVTAGSSGAAGSTKVVAIAGSTTLGWTMDAWSNRVSHVLAAFGPVPPISSLVTLKLKLKDPNYDDNSVTLRTKVFMRNMP